MKILAHRGLTHRKRENTLEAFAEAAAAGVDGIETDVRLTADGVLVLHHDRFVRDGRPLAALAASDLDQALAPLRAPRVAEALEAFPDLLWNLEIKALAALPPLLALLVRSPPRGEVVLTSFDHAGLLEATTKGSLRRGALIAHRPEGAIARAVLDAGRPPSSFEIVVWSFETLDPWHMEGLAARGIKNWVYGPQTLEEHRSLAKLPLEAVITDHPDRARCLRTITP